MAHEKWTSDCGTIEVRHGCMRDVLRSLPENTFHSCVTDPPYELAFMGRGWDNSGIAFDPTSWAEVLRVLRPGAHLLAFGGSRTFHRMAVAIEDAGFEIRDTMMWLYGSGFPKSLDVSKAIDKAAGVQGGRGPMKRGGERLARLDDGKRDGNGTWGDESGRDPFTYAPATEAAKQWDGWGSALKPAFEPVILARKPLDGTIAANVLKWGCGALNIGASRVGTETRINEPGSTNPRVAMGGGFREDATPTVATGRYPANVLHDGSPEVVGMFPSEAGGMDRRGACDGLRPGGFGNVGSDKGSDSPNATVYSDQGSAARFFWSPKASAAERPEHTTDDGRTVRHPTVKPLALIEYLVRLITPPNGHCLDPYAGSGTTLEACYRLNMLALGIELEADHVPLIASRLEEEQGRYQLPGFDKATEPRRDTQRRLIEE